MTTFDIIVAVIVGLSLVYSIVRGMVREIFSLLSIGAGYVIAVRYQGIGGDWLKDVITNAAAARLTAFAFLFFFTGLFVSLLGRLVKKLIHTSDTLSVMDRVIGGAFGLVKALVIIVILMFPLQMYPDTYRTVTRDSALAPTLTRLSDKLIDTLDVQDGFIEKMKRKIKRIERDNTFDKVTDEIIKAGKNIKKSFDEPQDEHTDSDKKKLDNLLESFKDENSESSHPD